MSKARTLAGTVSTGAILADGTIDAAEIGDLTLPTGGDIVGTTSAQTLTNKTIDIASNTLTGVQASLVSGTNIKTIGGQSVLGSGDLTVGGGSMVFLAAVNASSSSTVEFAGYFTSTYDRYVLLFDDVKGSVNGWQFSVQLYINGSYLSSGYRYYYAKFKEASSYDYQESNSDSKVWIADGLRNESNSPNASGIIEIHKPFLSDGNDVKTLSWRLSGGMGTQEYVGSTLGSASVGFNYSYPVTKIKLYPSSGNFSKGSFRLYGIKNS